MPLLSGVPKNETSHSPETKGWVLGPKWILWLLTKDLEVSFPSSLLKTTKGLEAEGGPWFNSQVFLLFVLLGVNPSEPQFPHLYSGEVIPVSQGRCEAKRSLWN